MPQVTVTIAGRTYRIACAEGEEDHLEGLAASYDEKIEEMRAAFGEIGDMRLHVMAAITLADEMREAQRRVEALEAELAQIVATIVKAPPIGLRMAKRSIDEGMELDPRGALATELLAIEETLAAAEWKQAMAGFGKA